MSTVDELFSQGLPVRVNDGTIGGNFHDLHSDIAPLEGGGWVVTWSGPDSDVLGVHAQIYDCTGKPLGGNFLVNDTESGVQAGSFVTQLAGGGFAVIWYDNTEGDGNFDTYGRIFEADGTPVGGSFVVNNNTYLDQLPEMIYMRDTGFGAVFSQVDIDATNPSGGYNLYEVDVDVTGMSTSLSSDFRVNDFEGESQYGGDAALLTRADTWSPTIPTLRMIPDTTTASSRTSSPPTDRRSPNFKSGTSGNNTHTKSRWPVWPAAAR